MAQDTLTALLDGVHASYKQNKKRNPIADFNRFLKIKDIKYHIDYEDQIIPRIPAIIVANHFVRPLLIRRSFLTTSESAITSSIITTAAAKLLGKKITWVVKNDLAENIFFLSLKMRKIQLASIYCYDYIGISKNYPFGNFQEWVRYLASGYSIGAYPEAVISTRMKNAQVGFASLLKYLSGQKIKYQILPVSIYWQKGIFYCIVSEPVITSQDYIKAANLAMLKIAANLPIYLQGAYTKGVEDFKAQARLQSAGDQKQVLPVPEAIST